MIDSIFTTMRRRCCVPAADEISNGGLCTCMSQLTAEIKSEIKLSIELLPCASCCATFASLCDPISSMRNTSVGQCPNYVKQ
jgi:hypothetical protein